MAPIADVTASGVAAYCWIVSLDSLYHVTRIIYCHADLQQADSEATISRRWTACMADTSERSTTSQKQ